MRVVVREKSDSAVEIEVWWQTNPLFFVIKIGDMERHMSIEDANSLCGAMRFILDGPPKERK